MPIEVRRFGVGHRRPDGPAGTVGIEGQVIVSSGSGVIAELAFGRRAHITPHSNPSTTYFLVIEGGGWVGVGEERTRVQAGEAVVWPADVTHAAWTEGAPMRAIVVELPPPALEIPGVLEGTAGAGAGGPAGSGSRPGGPAGSRPGGPAGSGPGRPEGSGPTRPAGSAGGAGSADGTAQVARGEGALAPRSRSSVRRDRAEDADAGEPL